jgi:hypothetical protein
MDAVLELEIGPGPEPGSFLVRVLRSAGGGEPTEVIRLDVDDLAARRPLLEASVLASAVPARRILPDTEAALRDVGERLFEATFDGDIGATYRTSRAIAAERGTGLQLALRLTAPELATLPWEALFDPHADVYLCRKEPLVRHVPAPYSPPALDLTPPLRILAMAASPRGLPLLDVAGERERLEEALRPHLHQGLIELEWLDDASWAGIHAKLLEREWHVLHFIGHGTYDTATDEGMLAFVGADGRPDLVPANALADLLDEAEPTPRLVMLNSCQSGATGGSDLFSGTAAALAHSGIHAVAAMQFSISDGAAIAFARGFYTALAHGRDVDEAVRSGRIGILGTGRGTLEWVTPVLYLRGEDARLFSVTADAASPSGERATPAGVGAPAPTAAAGGARRTPSSTATATAPTKRRPRRRWMPWVGAGALVAIVGGGALLLGQPWRSGDGSSDDTSSSGTTGWGESTYGIAGAEQKEGPVEADSPEEVVTGLWCNEGGRLNITATGTITPRGPSGGRVGPEGITNGELPELRILEDANTAALIGKLEDTEEPAFEIGEATSYECPVAGTLYLGINDTSTGDNEGEFWVTVTYVPPPD